MTDVVDGFFVNVFFRLKKKKKENSKKSWNIFATKWPAHDKWVKVARSYYKKSGKYSGNQSAKCACDLMLKEIKVETIFSDEKQTHGLERLADGFESIWKIYEERDDHSREAQERYLTKWMKLYNYYRTKFFQNCPSVAEYLDKNLRENFGNQLTSKQKVIINVLQSKASQVSLVLCYSVCVFVESFLFVMLRSRLLF